MIFLFEMIQFIFFFFVTGTPTTFHSLLYMLLLIITDLATGKRTIHSLTRSPIQPFIHYISTQHLTLYKQLSGCFEKNRGRIPYRCTWSMLLVFSGVRVAHLFKFLCFFFSFCVFFLCVCQFSLSVFDVCVSVFTVFYVCVCFPCLFFDMCVCFPCLFFLCVCLLSLYVL